MVCKREVLKKQPNEKHARSDIPAAHVFTAIL